MPDPLRRAAVLPTEMSAMSQERFDPRPDSCLVKGGPIVGPSLNVYRKTIVTVNSDFDLNPDWPSGEWSGFYFEDHRAGPGWMHLYLQFSNGQMTGEGTDYVGPWTITGTYDVESARCQWLKRYVAKHNVKYSGCMSEEGITGFWNIGGYHDGKFQIWPANRHDLTARYMQTELDAGDSGQGPERPFG